jgi:hypothetical protein
MVFSASMYLEQTPGRPSVVVQVLLVLRLVKLHLPVVKRHCEASHTVLGGQLVRLQRSATYADAACSM